MKLPFLGEGGGPEKLWLNFVQIFEIFHLFGGIIFRRGWQIIWESDQTRVPSQNQFEDSNFSSE